MLIQLASWLFLSLVSAKLRENLDLRQKQYLNRQTIALILTAVDLFCSHSSVSGNNSARFLWLPEKLDGFLSVHILSLAAPVFHTFLLHALTQYSRWHHNTGVLTYVTFAHFRTIEW